MALYRVPVREILALEYDVLVEADNRNVALRLAEQGEGRPDPEAAREAALAEGGETLETIASSGAERVEEEG